MPRKYVPVKHLRRYEGKQIALCGRKKKPVRFFVETTEDMYRSRGRYPYNTCGMCLHFMVEEEMMEEYAQAAGEAAISDSVEFRHINGPDK